MRQYDLANAKGRVFSDETAEKVLEDILQWVREKGTSVSLLAIRFTVSDDNHAEEVATVFFEEMLAEAPP